jgi:pyruvate/2-oxoglutarate dehydrogenase complex dihydrolipoamide acyltransferase (E2) component
MVCNKKKDINVGFVVSLKAGGIIVPAIHHTDLKVLTNHGDIK